MKKNVSLMMALSMALLAGAAVAADNPEQERRPGAGPRPALDANGDGVITREEAARFPRLAERFDALDKNKDGKLEASEMPRRPSGVRGDGERGGHGDRRAQRGSGFHRGGPRGSGQFDVARLDADGDGRLSREELSKARGNGHRRSAEGASAEPRQHPVLANFDVIDTNADGYIVRSELGAWQTQQREARTAQARQRFEQAFAEADANNDGKLDRQEAEARFPHIGTRFAWLDEDRDGYLGIEELRSQRPHR